jgi:hypothetical protein
MAIRHKGLLFFESSQAVFSNVTALFDFIWPTAAAMWNLRWQVGGYVAVNPAAGVKEIDGRFVAGSGIHGANLRRACIEHSWEQQQEEFARLLLTNAIALYESWVRSTLGVLGSQSVSAEKQLQMPTVVIQGKKTGAWAAVDTLTASESSMLKAIFYSSLLGHGKNSRQYLDNLLKVYRFFKECRNCMMHNGNLADQKAYDAYQGFAAVATKSALGLKEVPQHSALTLGQPVKIHLRGVVGFCDIVMRLVATLDAELARSKSAEREFQRRWATRYGRRYSLKTVDLGRRKKQIERLVTKLGFPRPAATENIAEFLRDSRLVG